MVSIVTYTGDGSTTDYSIPFPYLDREHVVVELDDLVTTNFSFLSDTSIRLTAAPAAQTRVVVKRSTPVAPLVDFTDGSTLFEADLDLADQQSRYLGEEARDRSDTALTTINNNLADVVTVAGIASDVSTVAAVDGDVTTVATNLNGIDSIGTVSGIDTEVTTVAGIANDVTTVSANDSNVTTTATNIANVNTVAGINTDVTTVSGISGDVTTVANNDANVTTVASNDANVTTVAGISSDVTTVANNDANVTAVAGNASDISTVAGINTAVSSVATNNANVTTAATNIANVNTVAGNITNVNNVGAIDGDVTTVAGISADVTTVAADGTDIGTVSTNIANVNAVASNTTNINAVAGNATNINAVAADAVDIGTVSSNISDVNTVAGISGNVTTVAGINANVTTVAGISSDVSTVAGDTTNIGTIVTNLNGSDTIGTVATNISNVNAVGADIANVNTAATNLTSINSFADTYRIGATDPTTNLDAGDLFYNTTSGTLKVYSGSGWEQGVTAGSGFLPLTGGTLTGNLVFSGTETVDGRDLSVDGAKLDGIEAGADVTDAANVEPLVDAHINVSGASSGQYLGWNGSDYAWSTVDLSTKLNLSGGTMTGALTLSGAPTSNLHAATKAYVDAEVAGVVDSAPATLDTLNELAAALGDDPNFATTVTNSIGTKMPLSGGTFTGGVSGTTASFGTVTATSSMQFGDNVKAQFGAGNDLQIYHDGSHSRISEVGTGSLLIDGDEIYLRSSAGENKIIADTNGSVNLFYDNASRFSTTGAGVSLTGDIRSSSGSWTGEYSGKIQYHNNEWYLQASTGFNFRNGSGTNVMNCSGSGNMTVSSSVTAPNINTTSDATLKTNVETLTGSLDAVKAMRGVSFDWIENGNSEVGVIAQEVEEVIPDLVNTNDEGIKSVKYGNIVAVLIEAIKEQQVQIDALNEQLNS